jgi:heptosyltransferase-1
LASEERILLVRLSHLGDVVHALPVFHALRSAHPGARIAWAVEPEFAGLLEGLAGLDRAILFQRRRGAAAWPRLASELAAFAPTWIVDAQGNLKSAAVGLCAPSARRSGLHRRDWREPLGARVLHDRAAPVARDEPHAVDRMLALAEHACGTRGEANFELSLSATELAGGAQALAAVLGSPPRAGDVVLALSAPGDVRSWPTAHWVLLARTLARAGRRVLALSGPGEIEVGRRVAGLLADEPGVHSWIGQRGLRELAAALTLAARAGARYVGVDSGPLHLAAACGLPVVVLEGPQSHTRTGPWPPPEREPARPRHAVVRAAQSPACAPCFARTCSHAEGPVCMERLLPALVADAVERAFRVARDR